MKRYAWASLATLLFGVGGVLAVWALQHVAAGQHYNWVLFPCSAILMYEAHWLYHNKYATPAADKWLG